MSRVLDSIRAMFAAAHTDGAVFPPTDLYNEGWMLCILLALEAGGVRCLPFEFHGKPRWFSEALLYTPFRRRDLRDRLGEGVTHADGVVGQFDWRPGTKCGLELHADAVQFDVVEAKMFSPLSAGTKNAPQYGQAARNVACIIHTLRQANLRPERLSSVGFYVFAPQEMAPVHRPLLDKALLLYAIQERSGIYPPEEQQVRREFLKDWVEPVVNSPRFKIESVTWESMLARVREQEADLGAEVGEFYDRCKRYNRAATA